MGHIIKLHKENYQISVNLVFLKSSLYLLNSFCDWFAKSFCFWLLTEAETCYLVLFQKCWNRGSSRVPGLLGLWQLCALDFCFSLSFSCVLFFLFRQFSLDFWVYEVAQTCLECLEKLEFDDNLLHSLTITSYYYQK